MKNNVDKLLSISSVAIEESPPIFNREVKSRGGELINELSEMLFEKNGFYAFESALHVFPAAESIEVMDINNWNSESLWISDYGSLAQEYLFFAEDIFGDQFCIKDGKIYSFDAETGEVEELSDSLEEWAALILEDYEFLTGYPIAHEWQERYGALASGKRLMPKIPFVLGGEFAIEYLYALDAVRGMKLRAELALQILDLPDGATIRVDFSED